MCFFFFGKFDQILYDVTSSHFFWGVDWEKHTLCDCWSPFRFHDFTLWQVKVHFWLYLIISVSSPLIFQKKNIVPISSFRFLLKKGMILLKIASVNNTDQTVIPWSFTQVVNLVRFVPWVNVVMWTVQLIDRNIQKYVKLWKRRCYVTACNLAVSKCGAGGG